MAGALDHPLVAGYLRELETALAGLPAVTAAELSEQIRSHMLEALPPDPGPDEIKAVLAALGPAQSVAAETTVRDSGRARFLRRARRAFVSFRQFPSPSS